MKNTAIEHTVRLRLLPLAILATAGCLTIAGCGSKTVSTPPPGTTATGGVLNDPQAAAAAKAQAAQQAIMAQREQQLMRQAHPAPAPAGQSK